MNDQWVDTTLGQCLDSVDERRGSDGPELVLSVTEHRGIIPQSQVFKKRIATTDISKYKVLNPMDLAYNPYLLWKGAIGQWRGPHSGVTSPVYECFRVKPGNDARFLGLLLESSLLTGYFDATAIGSIERRRRTTVSVFLDAPVRVPTLPVQRRIVDVMENLDTHITNLEELLVEARTVLESFTAELLGRPTTDEQGTRTSTLFATSIGGLWGDSPGRNEVNCSVFRTTEFSDIGVLTGPAEAWRSVTAKQYLSRALQPGDILMEKSGGTPQRPVGRVVRVNESDLTGPAIGANFLQILRVDTTCADPDFAFWALWAAHKRGESEAFQQASTNIRNLKTKAYLDRRIEVPDLATQRSLASIADVMQDSLLKTTEEITRVRALREVVLRTLLSGAHTIPDSYDALLESA